MATTTSLPTADTTGASDEMQEELRGIRGLLEQQERDRDSQDRTRMDRALGIAGSLLVPAGIVAILLGWYGAARTPHQFEQIPYLISGGLLGVAMVVGGGLLFFGSWIARLERSDDPDALVAAVERLQAELARRPATSANATVGLNGSSHHLVATPTGTMLHRPECSVVASRRRFARV